MEIYDVAKNSRGLFVEVFFRVFLSWQKLFVVFRHKTSIMHTNWVRVWKRDTYRKGETEREPYQRQNESCLWDLYNARAEQIVASFWLKCLPCSHIVHRTTTAWGVCSVFAHSCNATENCRPRSCFLPTFPHMLNSLCLPEPVIICIANMVLVGRANNGAYKHFANSAQCMCWFAYVFLFLWMCESVYTSLYYARNCKCEFALRHKYNNHNNNNTIVRNNNSY